MPSRHADVLIIGAGVIGAACCHELASRGAHVTLIDRGPVGHGCSYGNAGWITPCFALPLPMPGMLHKAAKWLLDPVSPLYIQPQLSSAWTRWMWRFLRSANRSTMLRSVAALTRLSQLSHNLYRRLDAESACAFGYTARGLLMLAHTDAGLASAIRDQQLVAQHGVRGEVLKPSEVYALEPSVAGACIAGGVYFPDEAHVEPLAVVQHLAHLAERMGAQIYPGLEVLDFGVRGGSVTSVVTTRGTWTADQIVLATGAWSGRMAAKLGLDLPMLSGKGYAVIVPPPPRMPRHPMMLVDHKVAITPRGDSLRLAGTLELVGLDESVTRARVAAILRGAATVLSLAQPPEIREIWRGLRPCTPDGVPVIGRAPSLHNLFIAAGHQMLGLQTATGTAALLAALMTDQPPPLDPAPFRANRFGTSGDLA